MLYLVTYSYTFTRKFIRDFCLKRDNEVTNFEIFKNDDMVMIIAEQDVMSTCIATTYLIEKYKLNADDIILNFGICYSKRNDTKTFLVNSVYDISSEKFYYFDMIFNLNLEDESLNFTRSLKLFKNDFSFFDNYSLGFYTAANHFLKRDKIFIAKNSTNDINTYIKKESVCENFSDIIKNFIKFSKKFKEKNVFDEEEKKILQKVCENLKFTETMRINFLQFMEYIKLNKKCDLKNFLQKYLNLEIKNKREVKKYFDEIREKLMEK